MPTTEELEKRIEDLERKLASVKGETRSQSGIWLEVAEVQFDRGDVRVQLKGDRAHPKAVWWPVENTAAGASSSPGEQATSAVYRAVLNELDKKRVVLARLSCTPAGGRSESSPGLRCDALRFQSADIGGRLS